MTNRLVNILKGNKMYDLEIRIDENFKSNCSAEKLRFINRYLGIFSVTAFGYLTNGNNDDLPDRTAEIRGEDFLKRGVIYFKDNNEIDAIIEEPFLGPRLMQFRYKTNKIESRRYQPVGLAFA